MDSEAAKTTLEDEVFDAAKKFKDEFDSSKMDTMIHRFPPGLGEIISSSYPYMVAPTFVAIGPYHHGKKHLEKMEAVKKAAAHYLWLRSDKLKEAVKKVAAYKRGALDPDDDDDDAAEEVRAAVDDARGKYLMATEGGEGGMMKKDDDAQFADMMICDASFLLLYMDAYYRSYGGGRDADNEVNESMRRFLFRNRYRINNDILLLENQLPWPVIQVLMDLASDLKLERSVGHFIAAMGSSFKIHESSEIHPYVWDEKNNPPPHLLALLRRHQIQEPEPEPDKIHSAIASRTSVIVDVSCDDDDVENNNHHPDTPHAPLISHATTPPSTTTSSSTTQARNSKQVLVSAISPMDLAQIGIRLTPNETSRFSDMGLEKGWIWSSLKLAPLSLSNTGASWLVNMAAFEVCTASRFGDPPHRTAACSYLALLAFFMVGKPDVRKLQSLGLLNWPNVGDDDDMLDFFQTLKKHLPDYGAQFDQVMQDIEEYKRDRAIRTTLYRGVYNNWKFIAGAVSIIVAVATSIAALIGLYQDLLSLFHS